MNMNYKHNRNAILIMSHVVHQLINVVCKRYSTELELITVSVGRADLQLFPALAQSGERVALLSIIIEHAPLVRRFALPNPQIRWWARIMAVFRSRIYTP